MNADQREIMLKLARNAIITCLDSQTEIHPPSDEFLQVPSGVFVTLKLNNELRGCIGYPEPRHPLGEAIVKSAIYAATDDPRFPPLTWQEYGAIRIEISVLSAFHEISDPSEVAVGMHGILITSGAFRGLLLPQVPIEHDWDRETFLKYGCRKAGLPDSAWRLPDTKISVFTAEVFGE